MVAKSWYSIKQVAEHRYKVTKLGDDFASSQEYDVSESGSHLLCSCFAGSKLTCRHRKMIPIFQQQQAINSGWLYQYDTGTWMPPQDPEKD